MADFDARLDTQTEDRRGRPATPPVLALDGLGDNLGLQISLAHHWVVQEFARNVSHTGLAPKQVATLWLVNANPGVSQIDLARFFRVERATMLSVANALADQELIERRKSDLNRRSVGLHITEAGVRALAAAKAAIRRHETAIRRGLHAEEAAFLIHLLKRVPGTSVAVEDDGEI